MHKPYFIVLCITALLNGLSTLYLPSALDQCYMTTIKATVRTPLKENRVALLVYTSRLDFNFRCAIRIFHLYKIILFTVWPLVSVWNKYQKYFLRGKKERCEGLANFPHPVPLSWNLRALVFRVCDNSGLIDFAWRVKGTSRVSGPLTLMDVAWGTYMFLSVFEILSV